MEGSGGGRTLKGKRGGWGRGGKGWRETHDSEKIAILLLYPHIQLYNKCKELGMVRGETQWFLCIRDGCWYLEERILDQFNTFLLLIL